MLDLNVSAEIRVSRLLIRPSVEFDNVLNKTVFSLDRSLSILVPYQTDHDDRERSGLV
jgi:hypothetical protein